MYLSSDKIKVFPSARRNESTDTFSRLMSESTIVSIVNRLIETEGFVITNAYTNNGQLEFNIHGYYFNITDSTEIIAAYSGVTNVVLYASIIISSFAPLTFKELKNCDNGGLYEGLVVGDSTTIPTPVGNEEVFTLAILEKVNGNWIIPEESKIKFTHINGGII